VIILQPAFGRDYKSKAAVLADFDANKDFILNDRDSRWDNKPINKEQIEETYPGQKVNIRYSNNKKVMVVQILTIAQQEARDNTPAS